MRDPYPPVSEDTRDYTEKLMDLTPVTSGVVEEFLALCADPEWECTAYYSTTHLTATIRPVAGEVWHRVECRLSPEKFVAVVAAARLCDISVKLMIRTQLAARAYNLP